MNALRLVATMSIAVLSGLAGALIFADFKAVLASILIYTVSFLLWFKLLRPKLYR